MFGNRRRKRAHLDTATNGSESVSVAQTSESAVSPISNRQRLTGSNACGFRDRATPENWFFHQVAVSRCALANSTGFLPLDPDAFALYATCSVSKQSGTNLNSENCKKALEKVGNPNILVNLIY